MRKGTRKRVRGLIKRGHAVWWDGDESEPEARAMQRQTGRRAVAQGVEQVRARITAARGAEQGVEYLWRGEAEHQA